MANTFYSSQLRARGSQSNLSKSSDGHNLRLEKKNPNYDPNLTKNNIYLFETSNNKILNIPATDKNLKTLNKKVNQSINQNRQRFYSDCDEGCEKLSQAERNKKITDRSKLKSKFAKWLSNEKTTEPEKNIFQQCHDILENKEKSNDSLTSDFENIDNKISRRNDKLKAIKSIANFDNIADLKNRNLNRKIESTEIVFKIPDKNNISVSAEHWEKLTRHFKNKYFPNNQMLYAAIHADENPNNIHVHLKLSGYNKKTKQYDYANQEIDLLKNHLKNTDTPYPIENKRWSEYSEEELKKHGELFQDFIFEKMNMYISKMGYEVDFQKRTPEQIIEDNHNYEQKKKSTQREHNRQNKVAAEVVKAKLDGDKIINEINNNIENMSIKENQISTNLRNGFNKAQDLKQRLKTELQEIKDQREQEENKLNIITDLIKELPSKINLAITAIGTYFKDIYNYKNAENKDEKIKNLSNHLDKYEEVDPNFDGAEIVDAVVFQLDTSEENKNKVFQELNEHEKLKEYMNEKPNEKPKTSRKRKYGMSM